jgi:hypothetical protein
MIAARDSGCGLVSQATHSEGASASTIPSRGVRGTEATGLSRRRLLQLLMATTCAMVPGFQRAAFAATGAGDAPLTKRPAIVVRTTENIPKGSWVWLLNAARDANVGRIYLLMKQDENAFVSARTERTWTSGELIAPLPGGVAAEGWDDPAWLDEMLSRARAYGIEVHAWWPCFQDAVAAAKMPHAAYPSPDSDVFLDPAFPEVGAYQANLIRALLKRFPFDGVALDWLRYSARADGSAGPLAQRFADLAGLDWSSEVMADPWHRAVWDDLRARTVADWVKYLLAELRPAHPNVTFSAFVLPWTFKEVAQSYRHLSAAGLDALQPMLYWRDWKDDFSLTSDVISTAPFYLSGRTSVDPTFDITVEADELAAALNFLPADRLGHTTWYHHGEWTEDDFRKLADITADFDRQRSDLYKTAAPDIPLLPLGRRLQPAQFSPDASFWSVICLGELHRRDALSHAEPIIPVLAFHRFSDGEIGTGPSDWHATTSYVDAIIGCLKSYNFDVISVEQACAYMTSENSAALPPRPLTITVDDGSATIADLFEPRAAAAGLPYSVALITGWVSEGEAQIIDQGGGLMDPILTWKQVTDLAATGRVLMMSHAHGEHRYAAAGPNGAETGPAMTTRLWIPAEQRLETAQERLYRVHTDLAESRQALSDHLGKASSFLVWPYGIYDDAAEKAATEAGFTHFFEFVGNAFAAPRKTPQRIMRVSVMQADEAVPVSFPDDAVTAQRWWLAFQKWARATQSIDLIEAGLAQLAPEHQDHPEPWISRAAILVLNGHSALAVRALDALRALYPHDAAVHASVDDFIATYEGLA